MVYETMWMYVTFFYPDNCLKFIYIEFKWFLEDCMLYLVFCNREIACMNTRGIIKRVFTILLGVGVHLLLQFEFMWSYFPLTIVLAEITPVSFQGGFMKPENLPQ